MLGYIDKQTAVGGWDIAIDPNFWTIYDPFIELPDGSPSVSDLPVQWMPDLLPTVIDEVPGPTVPTGGKILMQRPAEVDSQSNLPLLLIGAAAVGYLVWKNR